MPQDSVIYAVARVRSAEKGLIGRQAMRRIADTAGAEEAVRLLLDAGYGRMPDATAADADKLIGNEIKAASELVREVTTKPEVTDVFLMRADVHNLKLLIKRRLTGSAETAGLMAGGLYGTDDLRAMVEKRDYAALPEWLKDTLEGLEVSFYTKVDPVKVSTALDSAYIERAKAQGDRFLTRYFAATADFDNLLALMRLRKVSAEQEKLNAVLLPGGEIAKSEFVRALGLPEDGIKNIIAGEAKDALNAGLAAVLRTGRITELEKARDNYLMGLAKEGKNENETLAPVIGYLLAREQEARDVRLILTLKRNSLPDGMIDERMRELYGG